MNIGGDIDPVCFNRDRLFFGGKGHIVLYPDYEASFNAQELIAKHWTSECERFLDATSRVKPSPNTGHVKIQPTAYAGREIKEAYFSQMMI